MARNLIIFCDESTEKGRHFSHFYGGILVEAKDRQGVEERLLAVKAENNLMAELKWTKITERYKEKYIAFIDALFDEIDGGFLKVRVMFTQNSNKATNLSDNQIDDQYFLLYYQLIKHAFGLIAVYVERTPDWYSCSTIYQKARQVSQASRTIFRPYLYFLSSRRNG